MFGKSFAIALASAMLCTWGAWAGNAVTIVGRGNGPVTIIERDGSVQTVNLPNTAALETQGKIQAKARAARMKQEAEAAKLEAEAKKKAEREAEAQRKKDEEAKAKLAASEAKAIKEQEAVQKEELAHYNDKDYTYGPGSAKKVDRTAAVVNAKRSLREESAPATRKSNSASPRITVGGETRIRYNHLSR